jgi:hypothetical protein
MFKACIKNRHSFCGLGHIKRWGVQLKHIALTFFVVIALIAPIAHGYELTNSRFIEWKLLSGGQYSADKEEVASLLKRLPDISVTMADRLRDVRRFGMIFKAVHVPGIYILITPLSVCGNVEIDGGCMEISGLAPVLIIENESRKLNVYSIRDDLEMFQYNEGAIQVEQYGNPADIDYSAYLSALSQITDQINSIKKWSSPVGEFKIFSVGGEPLLNVASLSHSEAADSFVALCMAKIEGDIDTASSLMTIPDRLKFETAVKNFSSIGDARQWLKELSVESFTKMELIFYVEIKDRFAIGVSTDFPTKATGVYLMADDENAWKLASERYHSEVLSFRKLAIALDKLQKAEAFYRSCAQLVDR